MEDFILGLIYSKISNAISEKNIPFEQPGLTIGDICDLTGLKEGVIRLRIKDLVDSNKLYILPGQGRRPTYYNSTNFMGKQVSSEVSKSMPDSSCESSVLEPSDLKSLKNANLVKERKILKEIADLSLELKHCLVIKKMLAALEK